MNRHEFTLTRAQTRPDREMHWPKPGRVYVLEEQGHNIAPTRPYTIHSLLILNFIFFIRVAVRFFNGLIFQSFQ